MWTWNKTTTAFWRHKNTKQQTERTHYKRVEPGFYSSSTQHVTQGTGWSWRKGAIQIDDILSGANPFGSLWVFSGTGGLKSLELVAEREGHTNQRSLVPLELPASAKEKVLSLTPVKVKLNLEINYTWTPLAKCTQSLTSSFKTDVCCYRNHLPKCHCWPLTS